MISMMINFFGLQKEVIRNELLLTGRVSLDKFKEDNSWLVQQTFSEIKAA